MWVSGTQKSDSDKHTHTDTHTHTQTYVQTHIFFSIIGYYKILSIVPYAMQ